MVTLGFVSSCRAVLFVMDGLMLDTERIEREACQLAATAMGCRIEDRTGADTRRLFMAHYREIVSL